MKPPGSDGFGKWALVVLVIAGVGGWFGYRKYFGARDAVIVNVSLNENDQVMLGVTFEELPGGDATDVRVDMTSKALREPVSFSWPEIVQARKLAAAPLARGGKSFQDVQSTLSATEPPPLGETLMFRLDLGGRFVRQFQGDISDVFITVKVYWGGKLQDTGQVQLLERFQRIE